MMACIVHVLSLSTKIWILIIPLDIGHIYQTCPFSQRAYLLTFESYIAIRSNEMTLLRWFSLPRVGKLLLLSASKFLLNTSYWHDMEQGHRCSLLCNSRTIWPMMNATWVFDILCYGNKYGQFSETSPGVWYNFT